MSADRKAIGARLRGLREGPPHRSREKWAILLRNAAEPRADQLPGLRSLADMIKQWERSTSRTSRRSARPARPW
ncbi:hypothetical protein ACFQ07_33440 [Actinomadura adrarensis]|uniref:Uncharacterized protein n=1 Tax=Actinomadura adrarensis TaxID=1819600 RepID=A0ABW3CRV6_9ACTN